MPKPINSKKTRRSGSAKICKTENQKQWKNIRFMCRVIRIHVSSKNQKRQKTKTQKNTSMNPLLALALESTTCSWSQILSYRSEPMLNLIDIKINLQYLSTDTSTRCNTCTKKGSSHTFKVYKALENKERLLWCWGNAAHSLVPTAGSLSP